MHECSPECNETDKRKGGEEGEGKEEASTLLLTMETLGQGTGLTSSKAVPGSCDLSATTKCPIYSPLKYHSGQWDFVLWALI